MWPIAALILAASPARLDGAGFTIPVPEGFRNFGGDRSAQQVTDQGGVALTWDDEKTGGVTIVVAPLDDAATGKNADFGSDKGCEAIARSVKGTRKLISAKHLTTTKFPACQLAMNDSQRRGIVSALRLGPGRLAVVTCTARLSTTGPMRGCEEVVNGLDLAK